MFHIRLVISGQGDGTLNHSHSTCNNFNPINAISFAFVCYGWLHYKRHIHDEGGLQESNAQFSIYMQNAISQTTHSTRMWSDWAMFCYVRKPASEVCSERKFHVWVCTSGSCRFFLMFIKKKILCIRNAHKASLVPLRFEMMWCSHTCRQSAYNPPWLHSLLGNSGSSNIVPRRNQNRCSSLVYESNFLSTQLKTSTSKVQSGLYLQLRWDWYVLWRRVRRHHITSKRKGTREALWSSRFKFVLYKNVRSIQEAGFFLLQNEPWPDASRFLQKKESQWILNESSKHSYRIGVIYFKTSVINCDRDKASRW